MEATAPRALNPFPAGESPYAIHEACRDGKYQLAETLLTHNKSAHTLRDLDERIPLHWAVSFNHLPIVQLLLSQAPEGFDVDTRDDRGWTPLMYASSVRHGEDVMELLIRRGADVNAKNDNGQTPLHLAASKSNISAARLLLSKGATSRVKDKFMQQLPLHRAAAVGSAPMVGLFLQEDRDARGKYPIDGTDRNGYTALHHAIVEGNADVALMLLKAGAVTDKLDGEGKLAIQLAPDKKVADFIRAQAAAEGITI
ncbi:putative proteasome regulatory particle subunit [Peziza echinospora]|nr:putative proteasome regulatory particle subunit [Peziza echinospora]